MRTLFESYLLEDMGDAPLQTKVDTAILVIQGGLRDGELHNKHGALLDALKILRGDPQWSSDWK